MPIVPILFGFFSLPVDRSAEAEALAGLLFDTRRDAAVVRPRSVRPSFEVCGVGEEGEVIGEPEAFACVVEPAANGSRIEPLSDGDKAPFWLNAVTDKVCVAVVALLLPSCCAVCLSASSGVTALREREPSWSEPPATELGALFPGLYSDVNNRRLVSTSGSDLLIVDMSGEMPPACALASSSSERLLGTPCQCRLCGIIALSCCPPSAFRIAESCIEDERALMFW